MQLDALFPGALQPADKRARDFLRVQYDRYIYEHSSASYRSKIAENSTLPDFLNYAESLCENGYVVVPNYFTGDRLKQIRKEFERMIETNPFNPKSARDHKVHISSSRIGESKLFSELAFEPNILRLVQYYWGKPVVLQGTGGTRTEPADLEDRGSNQWHHDGKRKQVRAFILLTDVTEDGQGTKYIPGSNRIFNTDIVNNRLSEEEVLKFGKPVCCTGPAGSISIIDTNGYHRANRNLGPRRDIWNYTYRAPNPKSTELNPAPELHPEVVKNLTPEQRWMARLD